MSSFDRRMELGEVLRQSIELAKADIIDVCREIFDHPEPALREEMASRLLTEILDSYGIAVETGISGYPTAFRGNTENLDVEAMRKGLQHGHVAFLAEYDAPDREQHVAGKHLVAGGAIAAGIGLASALSGVRGTVSVFGCPASETIGGKIKMAADGHFDNVDAAMGTIPTAAGGGFQPTINSTGETLAGGALTINYGADSAQFLEDLHTAVQSVFADLGEPAAIEYIEHGFQVTGSDTAQVSAISAQITALVDARASASGIPVETEIKPVCNDMNVMRVLARRTKTFGDNLKSFRQDNIVKQEPGVPSDWGNVSYVTPTSRTFFSVSDAPISVYEPDFATHCDTPEAYDQMIAAAKATALTGLDLLGDVEFRGFSEGEFIRGLQARGIQRVPRRWTGVHPVYPPSESDQSKLKQPDPGGVVRGPGLPPDSNPND